jgi:beta-phosphoglucomutase-like phosphatase (HAD superfamily)
MAKQNILFMSDLDGTLVKTSGMHADAACHAFSQFGVQITVDDLLNTTLGLKARAAFIRSPT